MSIATEPKPVNWLALIFSILFKGLIIAVIVPFVAPIVAQGWRYIPYLSTKLHRLPLPIIGLLRRYEGWDRMDLALFFGIILPLISWFLLWANLWILLAPDDFFARWKFEPV